MVWIPASLPYEYLSISAGTWFYDQNQMPPAVEEFREAIEYMYRLAELQNEAQDLVNSCSFLLRASHVNVRDWFTTIQYDFSEEEAREIVAYCLQVAKELGGAYLTPSNIDGLSDEPLAEWRSHHKSSRSDESSS